MAVDVQKRVQGLLGDREGSPILQADFLNVDDRCRPPASPRPRTCAAMAKARSRLASCIQTFRFTYSLSTMWSASMLPKDKPYGAESSATELFTISDLEPAKPQTAPGG